MEPKSAAPHLKDYCRAASAEDEHSLLEARANVLETLADDENATPDALMASEILARAKGAASIPAALLAKWRLEGGLDDLLELLSRPPAKSSPLLRHHPQLDIRRDHVISSSALVIL